MAQQLISMGDIHEAFMNVIAALQTRYGSEFYNVITEEFEFGKDPRFPFFEGEREPQACLNIRFVFDHSQSILITPPLNEGHPGDIKLVDTVQKFEEPSALMTQNEVHQAFMYPKDIERFITTYVNGPANKGWMFPERQNQVQATIQTLATHWADCMEMQDLFAILITETRMRRRSIADLMAEEVYNALVARLYWPVECRLFMPASINAKLSAALARLRALIQKFATSVEPSFDALRLMKHEHLPLYHTSCEVATEKAARVISSAVCVQLYLRYADHEIEQELRPYFGAMAY
jgi:hypothetical protein